MTPDQIEQGGLYLIGPGCGVPYEWAPLTLRVIRVDDAPTGRNIAWLTGYEVNEHGLAVDHRTVYIGQVSGMKTLAPRPAPAGTPRRRPTNAGPAPRIPRPRTSTENTPGRTR